MRRRNEKRPKAGLTSKTRNNQKNHSIVLFLPSLFLNIFSLIYNVLLNILNDHVKNNSLHAIT